MMRVLIVEDDAAVGRLVADQLAKRGLEPRVTASLAAAMDALRRQAFDIVILDLTLPDGSGLDVLRDLRRTGSTAHVIVLSGAASELDRVQALGLGADDYVVKPFFARELAARVLAVQRRRDPSEDKRLRAGHLEIDIAARRVTATGREVELSSKEFDLLAFLAARPGHVFSRDDLLRSVWHSASQWQQASTVTEHMRRLRSKLEVDPAQPQLLHTVRGAGYRFDGPAGGPTSATSDPTLQPSPGTLVHVDGRIVAMDRACASLIGWNEEEVVGRHVNELVAGGSRQASVARLRDLAAGGEPRSQLFSLLHTDGREVPVEVTSKAITWDDQPAREAVLTPVSDASSRLRRLVTGVVTEVSDAVIVTDPHFHIRSWNRAAERLYGWTESEVLGRHVVDILEWTAGGSDLMAAVTSLEATGRWHGEVVHLTREGTPVSVYGTTTVVHDDGGDVVAVVSLNRPAASAKAARHARRSAQDDEDDDAMRRAIDDGQFAVYYQPVVALENGRVIAVEGLIRWNHPDRGLVGPDEFIDAAERNGLIGELGRLVLESACTEGARWEHAGIEMDVGVNLSTRELADPQLVDQVLKTLSSTGMSPHRLWLEVTETALVEDLDQASVTLHHLADLGVRISIDDFGTGWASLTYLRQFPVHALKIDRTFVCSVDHNVNDAAIVRSIVQLGAELGLAVVAEGIETEAQQQALQDLGCTVGQGFLYGRPTPAADIPVHRTVSGARTSSADPLRPASVVPSTTTPLARPGGHPPSLVPSMSTDIEAAALRGLLRIRSAEGAAALLQRTAERLGAVLALADEAGIDALPFDLSLGEGPPLLAVIDPLSPARMELEHILPRLVEDARHAVDLLRQTERPHVEPNHEEVTG